MRGTAALIDLHSHILPGIDDGPRTLEGSLEIARVCVIDGVTTVAATPHVRDDYPTPPATMERLVEELRQALAEEGLPLDVRTGGEVSLAWLDRLTPEELRRFGLAGNPAYLLVEFPYYGWPLILADWVERLLAMGITPVIAHPERNGEVQADPKRLSPLVREGALVQVTAASLDGRIGRASQETGLRLVREGLAHLIASDAHHASIREAGMAPAAAAVRDQALARWLVYDVPNAIVTRAPLPPRPG